jgi:hypothetical protein
MGTHKQNNFERSQLRLGNRGFYAWKPDLSFKLLLPRLSCGARKKLSMGRGVAAAVLLALFWSLACLFFSCVSGDDLTFFLGARVCVSMIHFTMIHFIKSSGTWTVSRLSD